MDPPNNNRLRDFDGALPPSEQEDSSGDEGYPIGEYDHEEGKLSDAEWTIRHTDYLLDRVDALRKSKELDWAELAGELRDKFGIERSAEVRLALLRSPSLFCMFIVSSVLTRSDCSWVPL
jgi:hypothetical protein